MTKALAAVATRSVNAVCATFAMKGLNRRRGMRGRTKIYTMPAAY